MPRLSAVPPRDIEPAFTGLYTLTSIFNGRRASAAALWRARDRLCDF